jgi:hypothetical protein
MHPKKLLRRRPSGAMAVALIALFASLAGASYAAVSLPANSVGTRQLRNGSVTKPKIKNGSVTNFKLASGAVGARKIINGAVGRSQININQVQERVNGVCTAGAITSVSNKGAVTCAAAPGADVYTADAKPVTIGTSATTVETQTLPANLPFVVSANPAVLIGGVALTGTTGATGTTGTTGTSGATESVEVDCTLSVSSSAGSTQTRSILVDLGANSQAQSVPLTVTAPATPNTATATVSCVKKTTGSVSPTVLATGSINALQTSSNASEPYAG